MVSKKNALPCSRNNNKTETRSLQLFCREKYLFFKRLVKDRCDELQTGKQTLQDKDPSCAVRDCL